MSYLKQLDVSCTHQPYVGQSIPLASLHRNLEKQHSSEVRRNVEDFLLKIACLDPNMFVWLDETGCNHRNNIGML